MGEIISQIHPSDGGHYYKKDGTPAYEIIGKNGQRRPTTLRDARNEGLIPSVTTIMKEAARPGLQNWIIGQTILSCLTMPRIENEPEDAYVARLKADSKEQARKAAERGTQIHAWIQQGFEGKLTDVTMTLSDLGEMDRFLYYLSAKKTLLRECGEVEWIPEKSFATERYGGKIDLHNDDFLIDIKSTDKDILTVKTWDEHAMQLAAYDAGIHEPNHLGRKCGILYINVIMAESRLIWIPDKELERGWACFLALLDYWYAKNDF